MVALVGRELWRSLAAMLGLLDSQAGVGVGWLGLACLALWSCKSRSGVLVAWRGLVCPPWKGLAVETLVGSSFHLVKSPAEEGAVGLGSLLPEKFLAVLTEALVGSCLGGICSLKQWRIGGSGWRLVAAACVVVGCIGSS